MTLTIATFNVNSIRARLPNVLAWLKTFSPDVALLQELKCLEEQFPAMEIEELGYNLSLYGQKSYNGVAILSKYPVSDVTRGIPGFTDENARYIEAVIEPGKGLPPLRAASIYVPNGNEVGSEKFRYKLAFLEALRNHAQTLLTYDNEMLVLGADYNVAPADIDVYDPKKLRNTLCFHPEEQSRFRALEYLGFTDVFRATHPSMQAFSWWDYRGNGYQNGHGMRIDHLLAGGLAADKLKDCGIDESPRGEEKASDHAPVWASLG